MKKTSFKVSAKTARLIGRENIADSDGALIELIKNGYDADAQEFIVIFFMPFPTIPQKMTTEDILNLSRHFNSNEMKHILSYYLKNEKIYNIRNNLSEKEEDDLFSAVTKFNKILLIDNGHGMSEDVLVNKWMNIGTNDKAFNKVSPNGRIKTGAKGIGRFALDKLAKKTRLITKSLKEKSLEWEIDWTKIDECDAIEEVEAIYNQIDISFGDSINKELENFNVSSDYISKKLANWNTGTLIILENLRDMWSGRMFGRINRNIATLNPIGIPDIFNIYVENIYDDKYSFESISGQIDNSLYDYKITAKFSEDGIINIELIRNELDLSFKEIDIRVNSEVVIKRNTEEFWKRESFSSSPFEYKKLNSIRRIITNVNDLVEEYTDATHKIGPFEIELYFLKNSNSDVEIIKKINITKRKNLLHSFSGIKIYRDNFKVRPYGEEGDTAFDWLNLSARAQKSPAAPSHKQGKWRVLPYQIVGSIKIGRDSNPLLKDMANRESLASNDAFNAFKEIIIATISEFEFDRQYFYREYDDWIKGIIERENKVDTEKVIEEVLYELNKKSQDSSDEKSEENEEQEKFRYKETIKKLHNKREENERELAVYRAFSASGIIATTFSHELRGMQTSLHISPQTLETVLHDIFNEYKIDINYNNGNNPFKLVDAIKTNNKLIKSWVDVIMATIDGTFEKVTSNNVSVLINGIADDWRLLLEKKKISCIVEIEEDYFVDLSKGDMYVILNNFFLNSVWFLDKTQGREKCITIRLNQVDEFVKLSLYNNGIELDSKYKENPKRILEIGESTKILENNEKGTGLGMWLIDDVVRKNNGFLDVGLPKEGFLLEIMLPIGGENHNV